MSDNRNDCQRALDILGARPDADRCGWYIEIARKMQAPGFMTDGTRKFCVSPCERFRWITVQLGWDRIAEFDQRGYFERPEDLARDIIAAIDAHVPAKYRTELTPAGEQAVIPGCERNFSPKAKQLDLFG